MQQTGNSAPTSQFTRHGLVLVHRGFNDAGEPVSTTARSAFDPAARLATSLSTVEIASDRYLGACTGDHCELADGGHVLLAGNPYFNDPLLRDTAQQHGAAAAVAMAYTRDGEAVFAALGGAFCCAIVDIAGSRILAAIDRVGQHSLYYRRDGNELTLGTCASAVLGPQTREAPLSSQGIYNYVYFHMVPGPHSVFTDLDKLQASHYLLFQNDTLTTQHYWLPRFTETTQGKSFRSMCDDLKSTLKTAVSNNLPTQGKVGAFLSGGLDSSTVTGILAELSEGQAQAYSIGFSAEGYDEMPFARTTARHFGVNLNEYYVTPQDVVEALPLVATSYDEPFGNSSALPAYFCARMAAQDGVRTLLAGDGGDELFAGNERYDKQRVFEHYGKVPAGLRRGLLEPVLALLPRSLPLVSKANSYVDQANMPLPDRLQSYNFLHRHAANEIFSDDFVAQVHTEVPLQIARDIYERPQQASNLSRMLYLDWQITLADNDLRKVSHMCALAGVDVTYPMIDDTLLEFSNTVPSQWKLKPGKLRHFYKEALTGWLPNETINKSKQGFGLPFGVWMRTYAPLRELAYDNLLALKRRGFIRPAFIDRTIEMHQSEHAAYYGELVWIFTVFELWMSARSNSPPSINNA